MITMRNTKAEMFAEINRLTNELALTHEMLIKHDSHANKVADAQAKATRVMPEWQRQRAAEMAHAKAQAMALGQTVKV